MLPGDIGRTLQLVDGRLAGCEHADAGRQQAEHASPRVTIHLAAVGDLPHAVDAAALVDDGDDDPGEARQPFAVERVGQEVAPMTSTVTPSRATSHSAPPRRAAARVQLGARS